jgi:hypothetical protein
LQLEQRRDNLATVELHLSPEHTKALAEAIALPIEYPGWMVEFQNARDPRGIGKAPNEAEFLKVAESLK